MKKPNLFNPIAATAACLVTSILNAALPPAPKWEQEALMAYRVGRRHGLDGYTIAAIQEKLKLLSSIPLSIINNEVLSSYHPRIRDEDAIEVDLQGAQTGALISTTKFHTHSAALDDNPFEIVPEQKIIDAPHIPLILDIYYVRNNNDAAAQRAQHKELIGSFSLSREELSTVEAIIMNHNYSEIRYKNGNRLSGGICRPLLHEE